MNKKEPHCISCGRPFQNHKRQGSLYCSKKCSSLRLQIKDEFIDFYILQELSLKPASSSFCLSEFAKTLFPKDWRQQIERVRMAARRLMLAGKIEIKQRNSVVKNLNFKGSIRVQIKPF